MCVSAVLTHLDNRNKSHNPREARVEAFRGKCSRKNHLYSGRVTFGSKNKPMEGSTCRSVTFTHSVDLDIIKIIDERKFLKLIVPFFKTYL